MPVEDDQLRIALPSPDDMAGKLGYLAGVVGAHSAAIGELRNAAAANAERIHAVEAQVFTLGGELKGDIEKVQKSVGAAHASIGGLANTLTVSQVQYQKVDDYIAEARARQPEREEKEAQRDQDMKRLLDHLHEQDQAAQDRADDAKDRAEALRTMLKGISALLLLALVGLAGQFLGSVHNKYGDAILPYVGWAIVGVVALYLVLQRRIGPG